MTMNDIHGYLNEHEIEKLGFYKIGDNVKIARSSQLLNIGQIEIGNNVRIDNFCTIAPSSKAIFHIGNNIHICAYNFYNGQQDIIIEDFCSIGNFCQIFTTMDDFSGKSMTGAIVPRKLINSFSDKVVIKKHTIIAPNCIVLPGVILEQGTAIGAFSLVKKSTKPFSIYAGVPAKFLKSRSKELLNLEKLIK